MSGLKSFLQGRAHALRWLFCGIIVALFAWSAAFFYLPGLGFTYLIEFGSLQHSRYLPELKAVNHYEMPDSPGYDSQWYVQLAMHPRLTDPVMRKAVDSLPYRARRILFEWTAWLLGAGHPALVMNVYAAQNLICWLLLAGLLFRWFPPVNWENCFRWAAVLFSFGLIFSVRGALLDGPSLLMTSAGMALIESRRLWPGAVVLGIAGLGKDTSILCGTALPGPDPKNHRTWMPWLARGLLLAVPLATWALCLRFWLGHGDDIGARNFSAPFAGMVNKFQDTVSSLVAEGYPFESVAKFDFFVLVGLLAQFFFFAFRIRGHNLWWRVGASYAGLMVFLGDAVWENYPSAAARVLLPMTLCFNVLVPRRGWWTLLLIIGNLGIFGSADLLKPPGRESYVVRGSRELRVDAKTGNAVEAIYAAHNWWMPEKSRWEFWRWSMGDSSVALRNPQPFALVADVTFSLRSVDRREAMVVLAGQVIWRGELAPAEVRPVTLRDLRLAPGDTVLVFRSDRPASFPGKRDRRRLTFSVRNLEIDVKGRR